MNSGIYQILNIINNKFYIGSSVNLKKRKNTHFSNLRNNKHINPYLQNAFNKYGKNSFIFEIIEYRPKDKLLEKEQYYIDILRPEYNIKKISESNLGIEVSRETREKMSRAHLGNKRCLGNKQSTKTISIRIKNLQKSVIQLTKDDKFIQEFESIKQAGEILNIHRGSISVCCRYYAKLTKIKVKTAGKYKWIYKKQYEKLKL